MLSFEPSVVVIDDKRDEVQGVIDWYQGLGVGCKFINADLFDGDVYQDVPYSDVNLVFLDLFYSEDKFDPELCANWIQSIVPAKSFYVLVVWSKDPAKLDEVFEELKKLNRLPFFSITKNKTDFVINTAEKYNYEALFTEISKEINGVPTLAEIGIWKKRLQNSGNKVIGYLLNDIDPESFQLKLQKIILGHGGSSIINEPNVRVKRAILFDALDKVLISNTKNSIPDVQVSEANETNLYSLNLPNDKLVDKELNSWFHFNLLKEIDKKSISPGLICINNHSFFKKLYSIQDDEKISSKLSVLIEDEIEFTDIVVVLSRPCDVAQGKYGKNIKLLSGILIKKPTRKKERIKFHNGNLPDSCKLYDHLYINSEMNDVALLFDFRYVFSVPHKIFLDKFSNLKVFNKELLSDLQVEYSSYSSRLGITQIL